jgi:galactokinase
MTAADRFAEVFAGAPAAIAWAPGRVNLIGEHTDYQGGLVLPLATFRGTRAELRPRDDDLVRAYSDQRASTGVASFRLGAEERRGEWIDYVQGVTAALRAASYALRGFEVRVTSNLPVGAGLSSSAALEVSVLRALRRAFGLALDDRTIAALAHRAETQLVGVAIGVMDQMVCSLGDPERAFFLDTRSLRWQELPLPSAVRVIMIDSGIPHRNAESGYGQRRRQVEEAARALGVEQLRDLSLDDLPRVMTLPEPLGRRARHVVTENARTAAFKEALERGDLAPLGQLLAESHRSLRDDYEVSLPEIDGLVELARATEGVLGARLTGGGFGGSVIVLADARAAASVAAEIALKYARRTGRTPTAMVNVPSDRDAL